MLAAAGFNELQALGNEARALLAAFGDAAAAYLIVGDHAARFHGHARPAHALELWVEPTAANLKRVATALDNLGWPLTAAEQFHLAKPRAKLRLVGGTVLLTRVHGLDEFAAVLGRADRGYVGGQACPVLCLSDLYRALRGSRRDQDFQDIGILSAGGASAVTGKPGDGVANHCKQRWSS